MRPINLTNSAALARSLGVDPVSIADRFAATVQGIRTNWVSLAKKSLNSTSQAYVAAIRPETYRVGSDGRFLFAYIALTGVFPNMIECGASAWDLRDTLLKSPKAKRSKDGFRYLVVPFRQMMPGATGRNASVIGEPYRKQGGPLSELMATSIALNVAKAARAMQPTYVRGNVGGKMVDLRMNASGSRALNGVEMGIPKLRERHLTDIYTGMVKKTDMGGKRPQNTYSTFRVISDNPATKRSDSGGANWTHPGFMPRNIIDKVRETIPDVAAAVWRMVDATGR